MKARTTAAVTCFLLVISCFAQTLFAAGTEEARWVYFSYDASSASTKYYYDRETVQYLSDNRVSVWLKRATPGKQDTVQTEIVCSGNHFRTIQPYKPLFFKPSKTSYAAYGWLDIPPDSEIHQLQKILCKSKP